MRVEEIHKLHGGFWMPKKKFKKLALGGTFDIIHKGHEKLIMMAFEISKSVIIGLTTDEFAGKLHKDHLINEYEKRRNSLLDFLRKNRLVKRSEIVPLKDPYGLAASDGTIDAIIVSNESEKNAHMINKIRRKKELPQLQIISVELVLADDGKPISTTRVKEAIIDRDGHLIER